MRPVRADEGDLMEEGGAVDFLSYVKLCEVPWQAVMSSTCVFVGGLQSLRIVRDPLY